MDEHEQGLPPVRRPKVFHSDAFAGIDFGAIDVGAIDWSDEDAVTVEDMEARMRRPSVRLRGLLRAPRFAAAERIARLRLIRQRASRGWTDNELWNLDTHLCQHLGSMLARHVGEARNHPPELEFDVWIAQIRTASEGLLAYDPDDAERVAAARAALHWAADHLVDLWD